jgi:hypothetical protein
MDRETENAVPDPPIASISEVTPELDDDLTIAPMTPRKRKNRFNKLKHKRVIGRQENQANRKTKAAQKAGIYYGMTQMNCADGCKPDKCVISERGYCAHPYKGGLQRIDQNDLTAINRLNEAKEFLGPPKRI